MLVASAGITALVGANGVVDCERAAVWVGLLSAVRQSLAGASVSVAVPFVAVAAAGVSPSFPGDSAANAAPAGAVRAMMIALLRCVGK